MTAAKKNVMGIEPTGMGHIGARSAAFGS
jgi:hypothetical protein